MANPIPPSGHGVFARAQGVDYLRRFDWIALNAHRADAVNKARQLKDHGKKVYLYSMPDVWTPSRFATERARMAQLLAGSLNGVARGYIADPENGWADIPTHERNALASSLARELALDAERWHVGVTSFPLFPAVGALGRGADGKLFAIPQFYRDRGQQTLSHWMERWRAAFGDFSVSLGVALWKNGQAPNIHSEAGYRAYLESMPKAPSTIGWTTNRNTEWMTEAFLNWSPGGGLVGDTFLRAAAFFSSPLGIALGVLFIVVTIAMAVLL